MDRNLKGGRRQGSAYINLKCNNRAIVSALAELGFEARGSGVKECRFSGGNPIKSQLKQITP